MLAQEARKTEKKKLHYIILSGISFNFSCFTLSSFLLHLFSSEILLIFLVYNFFLPSIYACFEAKLLHNLLLWNFSLFIVRTKRRPEGKRRQKKSRKVQDSFFLRQCVSRRTSDGKVKHKGKSRL